MSTQLDNEADQEGRVGGRRGHHICTIQNRTDLDKTKHVNDQCVMRGGDRHGKNLLVGWSGET